MTVKEQLQLLSYLNNFKKGNGNGKVMFKKGKVMFKKGNMKKGNVNAALKLLTNNLKDGIFPLNIQPLNSLKEKHPESKDASIDILLTDISQRVHPIIFAGIDKEMVRKAAIKTKGGSGPSAMDADG